MENSKLSEKLPDLRVDETHDTTKTISELEVSTKHGAYIRWISRTCCACMKEDMTFWRTDSNKMSQADQGTEIAPCPYVRTYF